MNINILCGKNTVEVLCMTEKAGLEKTVVFNLKSANESDVNNIVNEKGHESRSFYYKLGLLYFLVLILGCALIYKLAEIGRSKTAEMLLTVGIVSYALVNLWHIFNFVLLFCRF